MSRQVNVEIAFITPKIAGRNANSCFVAIIRLEGIILSIRVETAKALFRETIVKKAVWRRVLILIRGQVRSIAGGYEKTFPV